MTAATLSDVLAPALTGGFCLPGFVCLGWDDARIFLDAAEAERSAVILQVGPGARAAIPLPVWGTMLRTLADRAGVPVVVHLDHGADIAECRVALDHGFTSVMYDGSRDPLDRNIADTAAVAALAHEAGASCEGEIGFVGYAAGADSLGTDPAEAARFAPETDVDAMAVSIGNLHLMESGRARLDWSRLAAIEGGSAVPLVLHGGSGIAREDRTRLARQSRVCKVNVGTEMRRAYGEALRETLATHPDAYDRIQISSALAPTLVARARTILREFRPARSPA